MSGSSGSGGREVDGYSRNTFLRFDDLTVKSYSNSSVMGCVVKCFPIQSSKPFGKFRKIMLKELLQDGTLNDRTLPCFLFGKFVDQTRELRRGDVLNVKGFSVETNQHWKDSSNTYPHQVHVITTPEIEPAVALCEKSVCKFDDLKMISKPYECAWIVGQIVSCQGIKKTNNRECFRRLTLKEELADGVLGAEPLDCILYDRYATQNRSLKKGDLIKLTGFYVEARPSTSANQDCYQYQVVLDPQREQDGDLRPELVLLKSSQKETPVKSSTSPRQKPNANYKYTCIRDLNVETKRGQASKTHFNVYGVVMQCVILNHDVNECLRIVIRDLTFDSFTVFVRTRSGEDIIPDIFPNDIIRFHRMYLEQYRLGYQGICYSTKDLLVFSGRDATAPPRHTSRSFTWTESDQRIVAALRSWSTSTWSKSVSTANKSWSKKSVSDCQQNGHDRNGSCSSSEDSPSQAPRNSGQPQTVKPVSSVGVQTPPFKSGSSPRHVSGVVQPGCSQAVQSTTPPKTRSPAKLSENVRISPAAGTTVVRCSSKDSSGSSDKPISESSILFTSLTRKVPKENSSLDPSVKRTPRKLASNGASPSSKTPDVIPPTPVNKSGSPNSSGCKIKKRKLEFQEPTSNKISKTLCATGRPRLSDESAPGPVMDTTSEDKTVDVVNVTGNLSPEDGLLSKEMRQLPNRVSVSPDRDVTPANRDVTPVILIRNLTDATLFSRSLVSAAVVATSPQPSKPQDSIYYHCQQCSFIIPNRSISKLTFFKLNNHTLYLCPKCDVSQKKGKILKACFVFGFRLDDGSGVVNAYLFGQAAEYFLGGVKPTGPKSIKKVRETLKKLLCNSRSRNNPPVLDCYLFKYETPDGHAFQIVDTKLL